MEVAGIWADHIERGILHVRAFRKLVGVEDESGTDEFYVGGDLGGPNDAVKLPEQIVRGCGGNYFGWGVLENANGKTTQMLR